MNDLNITKSAKGELNSLQHWSLELINQPITSLRFLTRRLGLEDKDHFGSVWRLFCGNCTIYMLSSFLISWPETHICTKMQMHYSLDKCKWCRNESILYPW